MRLRENQSFNREVSERLPDLCEALNQQDVLLESVISLLPSEGQEEALSKRSRIKLKLERALLGINTEAIPRTVAIDDNVKSTPGPVDKSPGYLGEVSDIRFVNYVKQFLQSGTAMPPTDFESYDQGENVAPVNQIAGEAIKLPPLKEARQYIDAYFSTIHVAYPFIPESLFLQEYCKLEGKDCQQTCSHDIQTAIACMYLYQNRFFATFLLTL